MQNKKVIGVFVSFLFLLSVSFATAGFFGDLFGSITGSAVEAPTSGSGGGAGANICECSSCSECTEMLNDELCLEVRLTENEILDKATHCIGNPAGFNNKVFDCQGHTVTGKTGGSGVLLADKTGITVKNCAFTNFDRGLYVSRVTDFVLDNNKLENNINKGIKAGKGNGEITNNVVSGGSYGIQLNLAGTTGYTVSGNKISGASTYGLWVAYGDQNDISENRVCGNNEWDFWANSAAGRDNAIAYNYCDSSKSSNLVCKNVCDESPTPEPLPTDSTGDSWPNPVGPNGESFSFNSATWPISQYGRFVNWKMPCSSSNDYSAHPERYEMVGCDDDNYCCRCAEGNARFEPLTASNLNRATTVCEPVAADNDGDGAYVAHPDFIKPLPTGGNDWFNVYWLPEYGDYDNQDCDDSNSAINPGASEICNLVDDNCDGLVDEYDVRDGVLFCINVTEDPELNSCSDFMDFMKNPKNEIKLGEITWELSHNWTDAWGGVNRYGVGLIATRWGDYYSNWVDALEISEEESFDVIRRLENIVDNELCKIEDIEAGNQSQQVYLCQSPWSLAYKEKEISKEDSFSNGLTAYWIRNNLLFEVHLHRDHNNRCYDDESCAREQEHRMERNQEDIIEFLDKLVDNGDVDWSPLYLDGMMKDFLSGILTLCDSEIEIAESEQEWSSWGCKLEPAICPPHGSQTQTCKSYNYLTGEEDVREIDMDCSPGICSGCMIPRWFHRSGDSYDEFNNICLPYGARFQKDNGWTIREVMKNVNYTDQDGLSVEGAQWEDEDLSLEVFENNTALFGWGGVFDEPILLIVGNVFELPKDYFESGLTNTMVIDEIYYDSENYEKSYFLATFNMVGKYTYEERAPAYLNLYCGYNGKVSQQKTKLSNGEWAACQENFECDSNFCSGGNCVEINDMLGEISGMKSLGIRILCNFADFFGVQTYDECALDNLGGK
jgi:hypothetical protein